MRTHITVLSVSTPAVRQFVYYARQIRESLLDIEFHLYYLCGQREARGIDCDRLSMDLMRSDLQIMDLMGADGGVVASITPALMRSQCQRIQIGMRGPAPTRLGNLDMKNPMARPMDFKAYNEFCNYYRRCNPGDIGRAMDLILRHYFGYDSLPEPPPLDKLDDLNIKEPGDLGTFHSRDEYIASRSDWIPGRRTVALMYNGSNYPSDSNKALKCIAERIREFANVLPLAFDRYGCEDTTELRNLVGKPDLIVAFMGFRFISGPMGGSSKAAMKFIEDMDAPFLRPCFMTRSSREEWEERISGFQVMEFMINGFMPELDGGICIFPVGVNEDTEYIEEWGITLSEVTVIDDRLDRLVGKVKGLLRLKDLENRDKKVAIIGYNYPPGEDNLFGGSFLDTLSSLSDLSFELKEAGYDVEPIAHDDLKHEFLDNGLLNGSEWLTNDHGRMIISRDLREHPAPVTEKWGEPPGEILSVKGGYRIPGIVRGNLFIGIQPPRSIDTGDSKAYHDPYTPPHHQYLAFYEWLRDTFKADAVIHIGTHGTVEFLPGKENAMSGNCYPDVAVGDTPHFYLYYMGNPSEAMLAKRRTHGNLISYMSPPYVRSDLYGELAELEGLIAEYRESVIADPGRSQNVLDVITDRAEKMRLPTDIDDLEHELDDMRLSLIPQGFHIIGRGFTVEEAEEFALQCMRFPHGTARPLELILQEKGVAEEDSTDAAEAVYREFNRTGRIPPEYAEDSDVKESLETELGIFKDAQECHETRNLLRALNGEYTKVKLGGDFQRNPEIVPTGYNIVQFDPNALPSESAFARGKEAAENMIEMYRRDNDGRYPDSIAIVMWGLETSRTQGVTLAEILHLLGFKMVATMGDLTRRFVPMTPEELGRPRIDVTVTICGFFRDMFSNIVVGLNRLFAVLDGLNEPDEVSHFAKNTRSNYSKLIEQGMSEEDARDLSVCRLFGPGEGLYGTGGITNAVNSGSWEKEEDLSDIFMRNMGHAYSLKHRGKDVPGLMENNHRNVDIVTQMRDMVERELIDLDHYYEFFGGLCKTVEVSRGSKAAMYITDTAGPKLRTMDVRTSIEHGIRTRLLNPKWIDAMLETDYHGAQHINDRFENVLGLAATTGAVASSVFSDMEATYITDKDMRSRLMENNNWVLMSIIDRLYEANKRGYWEATQEELEILKEAYMDCESRAESDTDDL